MRFLDALAFLTRLVPARPIDARLIIASVPWFALAGLLLGICCTGMAWLFQLLLAADMTKVQSRVWSCALAALIWLALEVWISRGLHWDGLADLADALGGGQSKEKFREILKDSRLGTFGVLTLFFVAIGQWLACCWHISLAHWMELSLAPAWGRAAAVCLAAAAPPHPESVLGSLAHAGTSRKLSRCHTLAAIVVLWFLCLRGLSWHQAIFLVVLQCLLIYMLARLARQRGGISGDYLGSGIELSQLCFLTMTL